MLLFLKVWAQLMFLVFFYLSSVQVVKIVCLKVSTLDLSSSTRLPYDSK